MKKIKVIQKYSSIARNRSQKQTLVGLGLNKIGKEVILDDTSSVRGMVDKVKHLVSVETTN